MNADSDNGILNLPISESGIGNQTRERKIYIFRLGKSADYLSEIEMLFGQLLNTDTAIGCWSLGDY